MSVGVHLSGGGGAPVLPASGWFTALLRIIGWSEVFTAGVGESLSCHRLFIWDGNKISKIKQKTQKLIIIIIIITGK